MNRGLRNELLTIFGIGALGGLLFRRPRLAMGLGIAAGAIAFLGKENAKSFRHRNVIVTGGSRGLGLALAKELVLEGAHLTLLARDAQELERARQILLFDKPDASVLVIPCDITQRVELEKSLREAHGHWGSIDVLINNAGAILVGPYDSLQREDFEAQMNLHLYAAMDAIQWVLPHFRKQKSGHIINICSVGGKVAVPHMLPYDTSKFALAGFSQGLTAELEMEGLKVTTVYPSPMRTGSPIQAVFKGDYENEFAWFAVGDNFPGLSMSAQTAARKILQAARDGRTEITLSTLGQLRTGAAVVFPEVMSWTMALMNRLLPKGTAPTYHTGAESRAKFDKSIWNFFLSKRTKKIEQSLNQVPKDDAKFNLGLLH